jgi:hypothetical protein
VKAELAAVLAITKRRFCSSKNDTTGHGWDKAGLSSRTRQLFTPARFFVSNGTLKFQKAIAPQVQMQFALNFVRSTPESGHDLRCHPSGLDVDQKPPCLCGASSAGHIVAEGSSAVEGTERRQANATISRCPLYPRKRTFVHSSGMSAKCQ